MISNKDNFFGLVLVVGIVSCGTAGVVSTCDSISSTAGFGVDAITGLRTLVAVDRCVEEKDTFGPTGGTARDATGGWVGAEAEVADFGGNDGNALGSLNFTS